MGAITFAVRRRAGCFSLVPKEAVHVPREAVLQPAKIVLAVTQEVALRASMRLWCLKKLVLSNVPRAVLLVEDEVPEERSAQR